VRRETTAVALAHHLVSAYTSLVAVDVTPTAPAGTVPRKTAIPGNLPEGLSYDAIFGGLPQTATPAELEMIVGALLLLTAMTGYAAMRRRERLGGAAFDVMERLHAAARATRRTC